MGMRPAAAGRVDARRRGHHRAGAPGAAARAASATSPRTGTGTACCWRRRCGRTGCSGHQTQAAERPGPVHRHQGREAATPQRIVDDLRRPDARSIDVLASALSGGNQQKLIVGREMSADPHVLLAAHPTRGVDVGAQAAIWDLHQGRPAAAAWRVLLDLRRPRRADRAVRHPAGDAARPRWSPRSTRDVTPEELGDRMTGAGGEAA